jgi:hypothetical protein
MWLFDAIADVSHEFIMLLIYIIDNAVKLIVAFFKKLYLLNLAL